MPEPTPAERLREILDRAKEAAPEVGIDVTAVVEIPAKPKPVPKPPPIPFSETDKEREP